MWKGIIYEIGKEFGEEKKNISESIFHVIMSEHSAKIVADYKSQSQ